VWRKWVARMLLKEVAVAEGLKRARDELLPVLAA
jgi:hypothetical protein